MVDDNLRPAMEAAMRKIEDFYFSEEDNAGEKLFNSFA